MLHRHASAQGGVHLCGRVSAAESAGPPCVPTAQAPIAHCPSPIESRTSPDVLDARVARRRPRREQWRLPLGAGAARRHTARRAVGGGGHARRPPERGARRPQRTTRVRAAHPTACAPVDPL
eukprot:1463207-Prymnesium_polylepis.1